MIEVTMYQCTHCYKRKYVSKSACQKHEEICFYNPDTKSCATCINLPDINSEAIHCYAGVFISKKLKTNCSLWEEKEW